MKARLIHLVGVREHHRVYWGDACPRGPYHNAMVHVRDHAGADPRAEPMYSVVLRAEDLLPEGPWPAACDGCGAPVPDRHGANYQVFRQKLYDTASGKPEPGDLFWADWYGTRDGDGGCVFHDNCDGRHLFAVTPSGHHWDIDGRASNCTMPTERLHRCWIRHGEPPLVTVDKLGVTCAAGAGSIAVPGYHGFLRNGAFT
jgi:hypothetical protein